MSKYKSTLYALTAVMFWSTVATAFKFSLTGLSFTQLLFYSSLTSSIILFIISIYSRTPLIQSIVNSKFLISNIILGFLNPFLYYLVLFKAYSILPANEAQPLNYTWPIMIAVFSTIFLKQSLTPKIIIGLLISFSGVLIIATHGNLAALHFHNLEGTLLAAGSSVIWGLYWIFNLVDKRDASSKLFSAFLIGTILSGIYLFLFDSFAVSNVKYLLGAVYVGVFEMGLTFFIWLKALSSSNNSAKTSTIAYLSPFLSLVFIALILKENIPLSSIAGLILIVAGIIWQQVKFRKLKFFN